ncbi:ceramide synthase 1 LOH3-like [Impatiens glandulifera]|uniref:ceramide synthase 1 LOH3-like n=1 Tax=Impatiens glandulifera TaxID=253017 RepID=UPI001FB18666|nr:ceramide synthase 1 LOH3-like [Impatiens glandulifera]
MVNAQFQKEMGWLLKTISSIDWESESFPLYQDLLAIPFFVLFFPLIRLILDRFIFEGIAKRLIFGKVHQKLDFETGVNRKRINKFKESAWKCVYYSSAEFFAIYVTIGEPWFTNTRSFWLGPDEDQVWPNLKMKFKLKALYMYAAGFYVYSIFALVFWETRRSDFMVSMVHHLATVFLLVMSYIVRLSRVGSIILALHEGTDVFLEVGKMSKYSGYQRIANVSFVMFVLSWLILRLICFPFGILWSTSYEVVNVLHEKSGYGSVPWVQYSVCNCLLVCLLICHIYWWRIMFRMLTKQIQSHGQISDDVRSDSEGEDEDDHED